MTTSATRRDLSLQGLELFQICAHKGTLKAAADEAGLSVSTVSHHLRQLEEHLGVPLFDHSRRPMVLTPKGRTFLRNIEDALYGIRRAKAEASSGGVSETSNLRIGTIEEFDSNIIPELAVSLSGLMPNCAFTFLDAPSFSIIEMLRDRNLDLGITAANPERAHDLLERPLLRDPFVVVLPQRGDDDLPEVVKGETSLPFLRFTPNLFIARQIEAQLRRLGIAPAHRFECANNQTLMAMVASGAGWTITTPLLFARAERFHPRLALHRFPGKSFARRLSIVTTPDCSKSVLDLVDGKMRDLVTAHAIQPMQSRYPWLEGFFDLID